TGGHVEDVVEPGGVVAPIRMVTEGLVVDDLAIFGKEDDDGGGVMGGDAGKGDGVYFIEIIAIHADGFGNGVAEPGFGCRVAGAFAIVGAKRFFEAVRARDGDSTEDGLGGQCGADVVVVGIPKDGAGDLIQPGEGCSGAGEDDDEPGAELEVADERDERG